MPDFMQDMFPFQPPMDMFTGPPASQAQAHPGVFPPEFPNSGAWPPPEQGYPQEWFAPPSEPQPPLLGPMNPVPQGAPTGHFQAMAQPHQPMGQPLGQTGQPTGQPMGLPMGSQMAQPMGLPMSQPMGQPMGSQMAQPMGLPMNQLMGQPMGSQMAQPMAQPMGQPMGQPVGSQMAQPMAQPMGQPMGQPVGSQMAQPTVQPTGQPMGSQMAQPTAQPIAQAMSQPMAVGQAMGQTMSNPAPPACWVPPEQNVQLDPMELQRVATPQQAPLRPAFNGQVSCGHDVVGLQPKMVLAVDVDEVLCRCAEAFCRWQTGKVLLDVNECFQICYAHSNAAAREQFFNSEAALNAQPVTGAFEALKALRALNFDVHAITARPVSSQSMTYQFLQRCFPGMIAGLHLATPNSPSKGAIAKSLGACGLVDDQLPHVLEASQQLPAVLFDLEGHYSWTKTSDVLPPAVVRKSTWSEVVEWACAQRQSLPPQTSLANAEKQTAAAVQAPLPVPTVEVTLECVKAFGLDKDFSFSIHLVLKKGEALTIGRSHQTDAFEKLVPDDALRSCVSRSHFTISWDGERFFLKRLSVNAMFLDDVMIPQQQEVLLNKGGLVGLCSEANGRSSFLLLRFGGKDPSLGDVPNEIHETTWCNWTEDLSSCPFYLLCTMSASREISHLPAERRAVALTQSIMLGRQHQPGLFEGLLGDTVNLTFISRSHLELNEVEAGNFMLRNLSQNPVVVKGSQQVAKEQQSFLSPGDSIEFIAGSDLKCFLRFRLEQTQVQPRVAVPVAQSFWLELEGSAVKDLPLEHRRVYPVGGQLAVGRAFQHELHQGALNEEALAWVSREHFRVEAEATGATATFTLVALSSNPMWRQRAEELLAMEKHDTLPVERGDRIWLYTGASDGQPSGPGHKGTIVWTFCTN